MLFLCFYRVRRLCIIFSGDVLFFVLIYFTIKLSKLTFYTLISGNLLSKSRLKFNNFAKRFSLVINIMLFILLAPWPTLL